MEGVQGDDPDFELSTPRDGHRDGRALFRLTARALVASAIAAVLAACAPAPGQSADSPAPPAGRRNVASEAALGTETAPAPPVAARGKSSARPAEVIAGKASVIDGDGLEIGGERIRLFGVDAPEGDQYCTRANGTRWRCGHYATVALDRLAGGKTVACSTRDRDRYRRPVAVCTVEGLDVAGALAREGWALAYRIFSTDYVDEEDAARKARAGVWSGSVEAPWDYRKRTHGGNRR
jgi:endonuclease YncB( thermonuclease family)